MSACAVPPKKILLVDDERDFVMAARLFLESHGYEVAEAYNGMEALNLLRQERPDLIILDVLMPKLSGWDTLRTIQKDESLSSIPVLMLTSLDQPQHVMTGIDLGCTWYYTKPITDFDDLALVIQRITQTVAGRPVP